MPTRQTPLVNGQYYHIFNRGVARQPIFFRKRDYERLLLTFDYYRFAKPPLRLSKLLQLPNEQVDQLLLSLQTSAKLVTVCCYVFMPNHFHLILHQETDKGISVYISRTINSYTRYQNTRSKRVGPVFQGAFKAVRIETEEQLLHLSRYIHLNPVTSYVVDQNNLFTYPWSSLYAYAETDNQLVDSSIIMGSFTSFDSYKTFLTDNVDYAKRLEEIKHLVIDHEAR